MKYAMSIQNIIDIYEHRGVPKYRDRYSEAYVVFISNLKGGVSKTVSTVSLAHAMRAHPHLLMEDLAISGLLTGSAIFSNDVFKP